VVIAGFERDDEGAHRIQPAGLATGFQRGDLGMGVTGAMVGGDSQDLAIGG
jgi:hypothetical protein